MRFKLLVCNILLGLSAISASAGIVNSAVSVHELYDAGSINVSSDLDQGWHAKAADLYDLSESDIWASWLMNQPEYWFGQIYSDHYVTAGEVDLDFTVNYMGLNIKSPEFRYEIYGTDSADSLTTALALNTTSNHVGSAWTLLSKGSVSTPTAGAYQATLNFSAGYEYLAVRFRFNGSTMGRGTDYATAIDNISVHAVPEPAAIALLGLGCIVTLLASRIVRK
jgi:hypothetical protein